MISFEQAYALVTDKLPLPEVEQVPLAESRGRVLATDIQSDMCMPPFDKAAVDGFACRREDLGDESLQVLEVIAAGKVPVHRIGKGQCAKIMTGAMMPEGADCIVMVEQSEMLAGERVRFTDKRTKDNIARMGEDIRRGDVVLRQGCLIKPQHMAVLASVGAHHPNVYKQVKVCVMSTGDELVEPHLVPGKGQIRNSNATQLLAQAEAMGLVVTYGGIIADNEPDCRRMITNGLHDNDVLILSGGISMGDFDYIPAILDELGLKIQFRSIAVQPGKPTVFSRSGNKFVFALPGNPVSSFNIFELLAKPFMYRLMGLRWEAPVLRLPMAESYERKSVSRLGFVPSVITADGKVKPIRYHGSAHINALTDADALMQVPLGKAVINIGDLVDVRLI